MPRARSTIFCRWHQTLFGGQEHAGFDERLHALAHAPSFFQAGDGQPHREALRSVSKQRASANRRPSLA